MKRRRFLFAGIAVGAVAAGSLATVFAFTSGDDGTPTSGLPTAASRSTAGTAGGREPQLAGPANRYAPLLEELRARTILHKPDTFTLNALAWVTNGGLFASTDEGEAQAERWGYIDGFQVAFRPDGQLASVLQGEWFTTINVVLLGDSSKAHEAYLRFEEQYRKTAGSEQQVTKGLGNESSAWKITSGTVPNSQIVAVYHRFVFRRGNMIVTVQTYGGEPFMSIDQARDTAVVIDDKALGNRPAPTPTPAPTGTPGLPQ